MNLATPTFPLSTHAWSENGSGVHYHSRHTNSCQLMKTFGKIKILTDILTRALFKMDVCWGVNAITKGKGRKNWCTSQHLEPGWGKALRALCDESPPPLLHSELLALQRLIWEAAGALCTRSTAAWLVTRGPVSVNTQPTGRSQVSNKQGQRNQKVCVCGHTARWSRQRDIGKLWATDSCSGCFGLTASHQWRFGVLRCMKFAAVTWN